MFNEELCQITVNAMLSLVQVVGLVSKLITFRDDFRVELFRNESRINSTYFGDFTRLRLSFVFELSCVLSAMAVWHNSHN